MHIEVSDEVALHLQQLAKERDLTLEELISAMLDRYDVKRRKGATLGDLAANAGLSATEPVGACPPGLAMQAMERGVSPNELSELLEKEYPPGSLARFAQLALKSGRASKERVDTSARSREILNNEFADFVDRRIRR